MRRKEREVVDNAIIDEIISQCQYCRLGFNDSGKVYIVPMNYGFVHNDNKRIFYFHSAQTGRKIDLIKQNGQAGFELDTSYQLLSAKEAFQHSAKYQSIIGHGKVHIITDEKEKVQAMQIIMNHLTHKNDWNFPTNMMNTVTLFKLEVEELTCKQHI